MHWKGIFQKIVDFELVCLLQLSTYSLPNDKLFTCQNGKHTAPDTDSIVNPQATLPSKPYVVSTHCFCIDETIIMSTHYIELDLQSLMFIILKLHV